MTLKFRCFFLLLNLIATMKKDLIIDISHNVCEEYAFTHHLNRSSNPPYEKHNHIFLQCGEEATRRQYLISGLYAVGLFFLIILF